jgi:hypothetical protein
MTDSCGKKWLCLELAVGSKNAICKSVFVGYFVEKSIVYEFKRVIPINLNLIIK